MPSKCKYINNQQSQIHLDILLDTCSKILHLDTLFAISLCLDNFVSSKIIIIENYKTCILEMKNQINSMYPASISTSRSY